MTSKDSNTTRQPLGASFRDPSGFLFYHDGDLYRQINLVYEDNYRHLMDSGLYDSLAADQLLIPHQEVEKPGDQTESTGLVIKPQKLAFISYPYEWSFSQLKDAALLTLEIQKRALEYGMSLKDSSAYNIQFHRGRPILIDTLSFEKYIEGQPWVAYRQFCQHFLAPLSLMAYRDIRLSQLLRVYIDGIPLDLASRLLPYRTRLNIPLLLHIHVHTASQKRYASQKISTERKLSKISFLGLIDSLENGVRRLRWAPSGTEWSSYYEETNYSAAGLDQKKVIISEYLETVQPKNVWDLGANIGLFSRLASESGITTLAFDIDPGAVERNYLDCQINRDPNLLPLLLDLTNPSPDLGWHNRERLSWLERGPTDLVMALALIHHLAISNNVPLDRIASLLYGLGSWLVIEFVPKNDSQVERLLASREDIFPDYNYENFEAIFSQHFKIHRRDPLPDSERSLYLMEGK